MGAFHEGHLALFRAARDENELVVASLFVNPAQFGEGEDLGALPARRGARRAARRGGRRRRALRPGPPTRSTRRASRPGSRSSELGSILEGEHRPGPLPRRRDGLPEALQPRPARAAPTSARRTRSRSPSSSGWCATSPCRSRSASSRPCATRTGSRSRRATPTSRPRSASARWRSPARSPPRDPAAVLDGLEVDYFEVADFEPRVLAAAVRVGNTRLIDNVVLERSHSALVRSKYRPATPGPTASCR